MKLNCKAPLVNIEGEPVKGEGFYIGRILAALLKESRIGGQSQKLWELAQDLWRSDELELKQTDINLLKKVIEEPSQDGRPKITTEVSAQLLNSLDEIVESLKKKGEDEGE